LNQTFVLLLIVLNDEYKNIERTKNIQG